MKQPEAPHPGVAPEIAGMLGEMLELAMILRRRRFARGALELSLPEIEIELGETGQVTGAHLAVNDESHQVIEEFMLAANEAVATSLTEKEIGFLRRAHPDPEPFKLAPVRRVRPQPRSGTRPAPEPVRAPARARRKRSASPRNTRSITDCFAA